MGGYFALNRPPSIEYLKAHPEEFRFDNYQEESEFQAVLEAVFVRGMDRKKVDEVLVGIIGLQSGYASAEKGFYYISYVDLTNSVSKAGAFGGVPQARFKYNSQDELVAIESQILNGKRPPKFFAGNIINKE